MTSSRPPDSPPALKVVIAGGSGSLGRALSADLAARGQDVVVLTRALSDAPYRQVVWDGETAGSWAAELDDSERPVAVVNLAGRLVDCRPTSRNIRDLRESRVRPTLALVEASRRARHPVAHWVQGSTTAIYSDAGEAHLTESSTVPDGLPQMTGVARPWEHAARRASAAHLVVLRTSFVLDRDTPALDRLLMLARYGAGGPIGSGRQWVSWIHVADWLAIVRACLGLTPGVTIPAGPLVAASPCPVRNAELMAALRGVTHRPVGIPSPAWLTKIGALALGSDPQIALTGRHCTSEVLAELGWHYKHPDLREALADLTL